jgi:hypothetical protein
MSDTIEIKIDGAKLTPETFILAVQQFFALIKGVTNNICGPSSQTNWTVEVEKGSNRVRGRVLNPTKESAQSIKAICAGINLLGEGFTGVPKGFTASEIRASQALAVLLGKDVESITIQNGRTQAPLTREIVPTADIILGGSKFHAWGGLEGVINSMSDKHGFQCTIREQNYDRDVICYFQKIAIIEEAIRGFRHRALMNGLIRYTDEGLPDNMVVDAIIVFPEETELPTLAEIQAIYK